MRNALTPKKIAIRAGLYSAAVITIILVIPVTYLIGLPKGLIFVPVPFVLFGVGYYIYYRFLEIYIDQKIKLIYRTIHAEKIGRPLATMKVDMDTDVFKDINRNVESWAQDYRQEIQQLKDQAQFRREFVGNLSHELKTPITIIQGNILTLLEGAVEDESIRERFLKKAAENVERLESLIRDLDSITRLESGKDYLKTENFDLIKLVSEVTENLKDRADKRGISLKVRKPSSNVQFVNADRSKIDQVLTNLIMNSIKYGKEKGNTTISFENLGDNVFVEVKDDGVGIAPEHHTRLFERFYRVDSSRSRHAGGTGLGLAIVKHILDAHHQTISVTGEKDRGAAFTFTLAKA
ncbi:MAG: sensor histidine kinase [Salibacteraceae bacterium]